MTAQLGAPSAILRRVNIASASHAAAPSPIAMGSPRPSVQDDSGSDSQFSSQLRGVTESQSETPSQTSVATLLQQFAGVGLPRTAIRPFNCFRPATATPKQSAKTPRAQDASKDSTQTAPVAVALAVPTPEIAATVAATTSEAAKNPVPEIAVKPQAPRIVPEEPEEVAPPTVSAGKSHAQPQEMAFATRVQPVQSAEHTALPAEMASSAAVASANKKIEAAAENGEPHAMPIVAAATMEHTAEPAIAPAPNVHAAPAPHRAEAPNSPAESLPKATTPLKDISLQVNQPGKERVDVRVVQQGSEVHVSVHSGDASLTSGLRQGLSELQSRLEENGYRSEMWRPGVASAPVAAAPSSQESTNHSRGGDGQPQQGGSQQGGDRRNQQQSNQPRWVEELESSVGGEKSPGGFNGFSS